MPPVTVSTQNEPCLQANAERSAVPKRRYDVVIVGAGLTGCATARALSLADTDRRRRILLIDRHAGVHPRFSGELIHPRGAQVLDDLGFCDPLFAAGATAVHGFSVLERADGRRVDLSYAGVPNQRPSGIAVHHKVLVRVMRAFVQRSCPQVDLREGYSVRALLHEEERVEGIELVGPDGGTVSIRCDLVVAADGKGSTVRKLAGIPDRRETLGFTAGLEVVDAALPRAGYGNVILGAWGPVLAYPILRSDGGTRHRLTFDLPRELPAKGSSMAAYLLRAYVPFLPEPLASQTAAAVSVHRGPLEVAPTVDLPAPTAIRPGLALVGDAAGCSHPITASGMTMGLRDAQCLGAEAKRRADAPNEYAWLDDDALKRYRTEHDRYVPTRQALADAIYEAFRGGDEGARAIRRGLFEYWESSESARRRSMALLSCSEARPHVFLSEYLKTARHALASSLVPRHASRLPLEDRMRQVHGALDIAKRKLGLVARVVWAQVRPAWLPRDDGRVVPWWP